MTDLADGCKGLRSGLPLPMEFHSTSSYIDWDPVVSASAELMDFMHARSSSPVATHAFCSNVMLIFEC